VNHKAILGFTPLSFASQKGYLDIVNTLIANGADLNTKTDKLNMPLHLAAENGYPGIVNILIEKQLDVNAENSDQVRPLYYVCMNGHPEIARTLVAHGSDINAGSSAVGTHDKRVDTNITPLHLAVQFANLDVVKLLLEAGANVNARTSDRITPLHLVS
jgi:ankyrin repeat protein